MNTSVPESDADSRIVLLERLLRASERRYAAALASVGDGVITTDVRGCVTSMNPPAEALTKWRLDEAKGLPIDQVFPLIHEPTGTLLTARDGERIAIDDSSMPISDESGGLLGSVITFRDRRPQRLAEESLKASEERASQGARLDVLGRLTQGIAHDFNNILTIIIGMTDLLTQSPSVSAADQRIVNDIQEAGQRGANLVRQLLRFGRPRSLQPIKLDLGNQVAGMSGLLQRLIGEDIALATVAAPEGWLVHVDPTQTEQVLMNLAANARDAMPSGGRLTLSTRNVDVKAHDIVERPGLKPGRYVLLTVTDTGIGMEPSVRDHIFEPFFTTKGIGTGLGLATVYGIVKQWGGFVFASSEVGKGTTFELFFPALEPSLVPSMLKYEGV